ncbi:insulinase family protein, partial [Streptococcus pneumoniae]|nr:insulinase family protein [Streptococcus pneumoniae]
ETPETRFSSYHKMLKEDQIDIFFLGDFNEIEVLEFLHKFPLIGRKSAVNIQYQQPYSNILREGIVRKRLGQSVLEMGYHSSVAYGDEAQMA